MDRKGLKKGLLFNRGMHNFVLLEYIAILGLNHDGDGKSWSSPYDVQH